MTQEQLKLFNELLDYEEFECYKNKNGKLQVRDLQRANLGGIEDEEFDDEWQVLDRMETYHIDYVFEPLINILAEEHNIILDDYVTWEDVYNQVKYLDIEDLKYMISLLGLIVKGE